MKSLRLITPLLAAMGACTPSSEPTAPALRFDLAGNGAVVLTGGGQFEHPTLGLITFSVSAVQHADGSASGRFQQHWAFADVTFKGDVTCMSFDPVNRRAWIGGVLTHSNDPDPDPIFHEGHDAWFRVLDVAEGQAEPDRSTFLGFEGSAGIPTSEEYCRVQLWADGNARTWPVTGNIALHD